MSINWKFKEDADSYTTDFWYDLTEGGYIDPVELTTNSAEDLNELSKAISIVEGFKRSYEDRFPEI